MEPLRLRYFVAVAEELHFTRAAQRLNIAQPALSQQIQKLERDLGVMLFDRSQRSVRLTEAGRTLLTHARALLVGAEAARADVERAARGESGALGVGFVATVAGDVLATAYRIHRARHPDILVELQELMMPTQLERLLQRQLDIALGHREPDAPLDGVEIERLGGEPFSLVALPKTHRLTRKRSLTLADLRGERIIVGPSASRYHHEFLDACAAVGFVPDLVHASEQNTRFVLTAAGAGITLLLRSVPHIESADIAYRPLRGLSITIPLLVAVRREPHSPIVEGFLEALRASVRDVERRATTRRQRLLSV